MHEAHKRLRFQATETSDTQQRLQQQEEKMGQRESQLADDSPSLQTTVERHQHQSFEQALQTAVSEGATSSHCQPGRQVSNTNVVNTLNANFGSVGINQGTINQYHYTKRKIDLDVPQPHPQFVCRKKYEETVRQWIENAKAPSLLRISGLGSSGKTCIAISAAIMAKEIRRRHDLKFMQPMEILPCRRQSEKLKAWLSSCC